MKDILALTNTFEPTKANIETLAQVLAEQALDGADPIRLAIQLTALQQTCEAAKAKLSEIVLTELDKNNGKASMLGANVERAEVGTKYDFSDSEAWVKIKAEEDKIADKRKAIEGMAKNVPDGSELQWTDTDTGETLSVKKASKTSKTSFKITLGK